MTLPEFSQPPLDGAFYAGYFVAATDLTPQSTSSLWDGEVHLTFEAALASVNAITERPEWYSTETRADYTVYGLTPIAGTEQ